jgi:hypothetical protein
MTPNAWMGIAVCLLNVVLALLRGSVDVVGLGMAMVSWGVFGWAALVEASTEQRRRWIAAMRADIRSELRAWEARNRVVDEQILHAVARLRMSLLEGGRA